MLKYSSDNWSAGANNLETPDRLPKYSVRYGVNVDPLPGGHLASRIGYESVYAGTDVRGVLALGNKLLIADGDQLIEYDTVTAQVAQIRTIAGSGAFCGDVMNERLYFCTETECLEYDGVAVRPWGVPDLFQQPVTRVIAGGLLPGHYQVAVTFIDQWGREGGTAIPRVMRCEAGEGIEVDIDVLPAHCQANIYVSAADGQTLYRQACASEAGSVQIATVRDYTAECATVLLRGPRPASRVTRHNGVLLMAVGSCVEYTLPMQAHLTNRARTFFQYPVPVGDLMSSGLLAYVSADKCYALSGLETGEPSQRVILDYPAMPGTSVRLPDMRSTWMTPYGQAFSTEFGLDLPGLKVFAPSVADKGAAGVIDSNGSQLIVTTTRGKQTGNELAAVDFYIGEILNP